MAHHVGSQPPRWLHIAQDGSQEAFKMAHHASKTAHGIPKTPPDEPRKAKIIENPMVFQWFLLVCVLASQELQKCPGWPQDSPKWSWDGPKTALDGPKTAPRRPQEGLKEAQVRSRGAQDGAKMAQVRSKREPKRAPRGNSDPSWLGDPSRTTLGPLQKPSGTPSGTDFGTDRRTFCPFLV